MGVRQAIGPVDESLLHEPPESHREPGFGNADQKVTFLLSGQGPSEMGSNTISIRR